MRDCFDDGVFFVPLAPITNPDLVAPTIMQTLGLKESSRQSPVDHLSDYLRDKLMLLVLDNLEQVIAAAPMIARLLAACPLLKILATSRIALRVRAERQFPVPPLALPDLTRLPAVEELSHYSALALFAERAQAVLPDLALTAENGEAIARICHRLDGLPLAIELIAARVKLLSPAEILHRLGGRFLLQSDGLRDIDERQRTLENAIEWSYNLLTTEERTLFTRLAVFVGGWTLEAAEAVCLVKDEGGRMKNEGTLRAMKDQDHFSEILDRLTSLVNKSLIVRHEEMGESRFAMLETIRAYALECLETSGETQAARRRHAAFFAGWAEQVEQKLRGAEQMAWLKRLEKELDNLRAVLSWSLERDGTDADLGLRLFSALRGFWLMADHQAEAFRWLYKILDKSRSSHSVTIKAKALGTVCVLLDWRGDADPAAAAARESLALYRHVQDKHGIAWALRDLGDVLSSEDCVQATELLEQSLALFQELLSFD